MPKEKKKSSGMLDKIKFMTYGGGGTGVYGLEKLSELLGVGGGLGFFKDGGRVRGVGKATHGYGKAMKKQRKK